MNLLLDMGNLLAENLFGNLMLTFIMGLLIIAAFLLYVRVPLDFVILLTLPLLLGASGLVLITTFQASIGLGVVIGALGAIALVIAIGYYIAQQWGQ